MKSEFKALMSVLIMILQICYTYQAQRQPWETYLLLDVKHETYNIICHVLGMSWEI